MGVVSSMRRRRYEKKAAYKAAKVQAKATAKANAKADRDREKYLRKTAGKIRSIDAKAAKRQDKKDAQTAKALVAEAKSKKVTAGKVIGWVGAARAILPVATPLVYRGLARLGSSDAGKNLSSLFGSLGAGAAPGEDAVQRARIADLRNRAESRNVPDSVRSTVTRKLTSLESSLSADTSASALSSVSTELDLLDSQLDDAVRK